MGPKTKSMKSYKLKNFKLLSHINPENHIVRFFYDTVLYGVRNIPKQDSNLIIIFAIYFPIKGVPKDDTILKLKNIKNPWKSFSTILTTDSNIFYKIIYFNTPNNEQ